jgi:arabinan endo-1,5-alpha-L-arabinosidase
MRTGWDLKETSAPYAGGPWQPTNDVLDTSSIPGWVDISAQIWGPDIISISSSRFVVYFSAITTAGNGKRCIGAAVGSTPTGPFTMDQNPLVCAQANLPPGYTAQDTMTNRGHADPDAGVIAASPRFVTVKGVRELVMLYKTEQNLDPSNPYPSTIRMVQLSTSDGTTLASDLTKSHELIYSTNGAIIEGPSLVQTGNYYVLFIAHGVWDKCEKYTTWWFKSTSLWNWDSYGGTMLMNQDNTGLCGPGTADVTEAEVSGQYRIFFDGWTLIKCPDLTVPVAGQCSNGDLNLAYISSQPATDTDISSGNAARPMYARVLTIGSDGTPSVGEFLGQP